MASGFEGLAVELRTIAAGTGARPDKARRAAATIAKVGDYRWVGLYDVGAEDIAVIGWAGPGPPAHPVFPRAQGLNGAAVESGLPVIVQDVSQDPRYLTTLGSTRAEMIVPVRIEPQGDVVGTIDVESERVHPFTHQDRLLLEAAADALAPLWHSGRGVR